MVLTMRSCGLLANTIPGRTITAMFLWVRSVRDVLSRATGWIQLK